MNQQTPSHQEKIICPECGAVQVAEVLHTVPWASYVHNCDQCGYIIMESEWTRAPETAVNTGNLLAFAAEAEAVFAAREETQRENAKLREAIKRLQANTAARNPGRAQ